MTAPEANRAQAAACADLLRFAMRSLAVGLAAALFLAGAVVALAAVNDPDAGISELPRLLEHAQPTHLLQAQSATGVAR